ncbi:TPA: VaFE repeat-containing surface-anchored protein, partial [Corynebacterium aurimucosum]|nr:VaFE repeat-containing surface-anchored protein [Corynebacterium aurimucosum]
PDEETTPNTPDKETTPNTTEKTTEPGESTTPNTTEKTTEPGESTTPNTTEKTTEPGESTTPDKSGEPKIKTQAKFAEGSTQVVAGAKVEDTVTYEGLVPDKEYTLNAELISKADGKTVLGKGEETFTPESANGEVVVTITVDESV